jgi:beta-lactamase class A
VAASMDKRNQPEKPESEQGNQQNRKPINRLIKPQANDLERIRRSPATLKELAQRLRQPNPEPLNPDRLRSRKHRQRLQAQNPEATPIPPGSRPKTVPLKGFRAQPAAPQLPSHTPPSQSNPPRLVKGFEQLSNLQPPQDYRQNGYSNPSNSSASNKLRPPNPWAVNPTNHLPPTEPVFNSNQEAKSINPRRVGQRRPSAPTLASGQFQSDLGKRRRDQTVPPVSETQSKPTRNRRGKVNPVAPSPAKNPPPIRPQKRPFGALVYVVRLLVLGIGIGVIAGTLLSALNPTMQASVDKKEQDKSQKEAKEAIVASPSPTLQLTQEIPVLKAQIQTLVRQNPTLNPGVFVVDLETGGYIDLNGGTLFASASTIKLPILVAFFQDIDAGKVRLDEMLTMKSEMIADGSGDLQYKKVGTPFSALEVATKMMVISDNTATNMLIERLGGKEVLNQRFQSWGLTTTAIRNRLPDVEGTNTTSPKELANLLSVVNRGNLVSLPSRDRLLSIMQRNEINNLLPQGLGTGAGIAHKTGNIGSLLADAGIVDLPTGKRYAIAVMVKRPFNDPGAQELIRQISRKTYDYFNTPRATPSNNQTPSRNTRTLTRAIAAEISLN